VEDEQEDGRPDDGGDPGGGVEEAVQAADVENLVATQLIQAMTPVPTP
jgi:hypothetical protein